MTTPRRSRLRRFMVMALGLCGGIVLAKAAAPTLLPALLLPDGVDLDSRGASLGWTGRVVATDVRVRWAGGSARADTLHAHLVPFGPFRLRSVRLVSPAVVLEGTSGASGAPMALPRVAIGLLEVVRGRLEGRYVAEAGGDTVSWRLAGVTLAATDVRTGPDPTGLVDSLSMEADASTLADPVLVRLGAAIGASGPEVDVSLRSSRSDLAFVATGRWGGGVAELLRSFEGELVARPLDVADLVPFLGPGLPEGTIVGTVQVDGPAGQAIGQLDVDLGSAAAGTVTGTLEASPDRPFRADLDARIRTDAPARLGMPLGHPAEAEVRVELAGPSWPSASGTVAGRILSEGAGMDARFRAVVDSGAARVEADVTVRGVAGTLVGSTLLAEPRRWTLSADAPGLSLGADGALSLEGRPVLQARVRSSGPWIDSARVSFGDSTAGQVRGTAFAAGGTAELLGTWTDATLAVERLALRRWEVPVGVGGAWSGLLTARVSDPFGARVGQATLRVDSVLGGRLDRSTLVARAALNGEITRIDADIARGADSLRTVGALRLGGASWRAEVERAYGRLTTPVGPTRIEWDGPLGLGPAGWSGGGRMESAPLSSGDDPGWRLVGDVAASADGVRIDGRVLGSTGSATFTADLSGTWDEPGAARLDVAVDSLPLVDRHSWVAVARTGALAATAPSWRRPLEGAQASYGGGMILGELAIDSVRAEAWTREDGRVGLAVELQAAGLTADASGTAALEGGLRADSMLAAVQVSNAAALDAVTGGRLGGTGGGELRWSRADAEVSASGEIVVEGASAAGWTARRVHLALADVRLGGRPSGALEARATGFSSIMGGPPLDMSVSLQANGGDASLRTELGPDLVLDASGPLEDTLWHPSTGSLVVARDTLVLVPGSVVAVGGARPGVDRLTFEGRQGASRLWLGGGPGGDEAWWLEAEATNLPSPELMLAVPWVPVRGGRLTASTRLTSARSAPVIGIASARLRTPVSSGDTVTLLLEAALDTARIGLEVDAELGGRHAALVVDLPRAEGAGRAPRLEISADDFPLDAIGDRADGGAVRGGRLSGRIARVGPDDSAEIEGTLTARADAWRMPGTDIEMTDLRATLTGSGRGVRVEAGANEGSGRATVSGTVDLLTASPTLDVTVGTERFPVAWSPSFVLRTEGDLDISGTLARPRIDGDVRVEASEILLGGETVVEPVDLTEEDRALLRERFGWRERGSTTGSWLPLAALSADLRVELGGDVWVRRWTDPELALALTGSLEVRKEPNGSFEYFGRVTPLSAASGFRQFGRRFTVTSGAIDLVGPIEDVEFTFVGRHEIPSRTDPGTPEAVILMTVRGSPDDVSVVLESEPSLEQTDIVSYLLLGQPSDRVSTAGGESAAEAGAGIALARLSALLGEAGSQTIGLDVVDLEPRGLGGVTLVVGRYLTPRLFVSVRQPVAWQPGTESSGIERLPAVEAELSTARRLLLNLTGDAKGFGLVLRGRWGY